MWSATHPVNLELRASEREGQRLRMPWDCFRHKALLLPLPQPKQALLRPKPRSAVLSLSLHVG